MLSQKIVLTFFFIVAYGHLCSQVKTDVRWDCRIEYQCPWGWKDYNSGVWFSSDFGWGVSAKIEGGKLTIHKSLDKYTFEINSERCVRKGTLSYSNFFSDKESLHGYFETDGDNTAMWGTGICCRGSITLERELSKEEKKPVKKQNASENNLHNLNAGEKYTLKNVIFALSSGELEPSSYTELNKVYAMLEKNKKMVICLEGHTDVIGNHKANKKLSRDRVKAIKKYLSQKGIASKRIKLKWYGDTRPLLKSGTAEERKINRRVELILLSS